MGDPPSPLALAERVAEAARGLGIATTLIGAAALAAHGYVRGTGDIDLATRVDPHDELARLERILRDAGLRVELRMPDEDVVLGGVLVVWEREEEDGNPLEPVEVVNFLNPHGPRPNPARDAIANAIPLDDSNVLTYPRLADLIALKLYAGSRRDLADIVELLAHNPQADLDEIRAAAEPYDRDTVLDTLIEEARQSTR
jgi:hypothetical protein